MKPTSIRLTEKSEKALVWLRTQPGGFNLTKAFNQFIEEEAKRRGKGES